MTGWGLTDKGVVRSQNQDAFFLHVSHEDNQAIAAVCDGMGGARAGDIASNLAVEIFVEEARRALSPDLDANVIGRVLANATQAANSAVFEKSCSEDGVFAGMGTTLVGALMSGFHAVVVNVGDSRAYRIGQGGIARVTRDHSLVEDLMAKGDITVEQARYHPRRNLITRALGTDPQVDCDLFYLEMSPGEFLLLCSDGLTNVAEDQEIQSEVLLGGEPARACTQLLRLACNRGGPDNITAVIISL